jgi:hypothetical protein
MLHNILTRIGRPHLLVTLPNDFPSVFCPEDRVMHAGAVPSSANAGELTLNVTPTAAATAKAVATTVRMASLLMSQAVE